MFLVPLAILAGSFAFRRFATLGTNRDQTWGGIAAVSSWSWRIMLWVLTTCVWLTYARLAVWFVGYAWLGDGEGLPGYVLGMAVVGCAAISAVFFLCRAPEIATGLLVGIFFAGSLTLTAVWYGCATYTLRDESRALVPNGSGGPFLLGTLCYELALENRSFPICDPWLPWIVDMRPFNPWFAQACDRLEFLLLVDESSPHCAGECGFPRAQVEAVVFAAHEAPQTARIMPHSAGGRLPVQGHALSRRAGRPSGRAVGPVALVDSPLRPRTEVSLNFPPPTGRIEYRVA